MIKILQEKLMDVENIMKLIYFLKHIRAIEEIIKLWCIEAREMACWVRMLALT